MQEAAVAVSGWTLAALLRFPRVAERLATHQVLPRLPRACGITGQPGAH